MNRNNKYRNKILKKGFGNPFETLFEIPLPLPEHKYSRAILNYHGRLLMSRNANVTIRKYGGTDEPVEWEIKNGFITIKTPAWWVLPKKISVTVRL
jgi:hypothetical protein